MSSGISVIIPFYNGEDVLPKALNSVGKQTLKPLEIIIVDDGSTKFMSLPDKIDSIPIVRLRTQNRGQSNARNSGVHSSKGNLICFLDQDDYFLPTHLEKLYEIAEEDNPSWIFSYSNFSRINSKGELLHNFHSTTNCSHPPRDLNTSLMTNMYILPSSTMISKKWFLQVGGFDTSLQGYEDDDLIARLIATNGKITYCPNDTLVWVDNPNSTSYSSVMEKSRLRFLQKWTLVVPPFHKGGLWVRGAFPYFYRFFYLRKSSFSIMIREISKLYAQSISSLGKNKVLNYTSFFCGILYFFPKNIVFAMKDLFRSRSWR